ncbi:MAG: helix-turn-helix transcriptional regulator [Myxococcota bacterium]
MKALEEHGVPLTREGEGQEARWVLGPGWRHLGLHLSLSDRLGMMFGRELVQSFLHGTDVGDAVARLDAQVAALDTDAPGDVHLKRRFFYIHEPEKEYSTHREAIRTLIGAILSGHRITFTYRSARAQKATERRAAMPLTLAAYKRGLYLFYWECRSDVVQEAAIERIASLTSHPELSFQYPPPSEYDPGRHLAGRFGIAVGEHPVETVRLWCAPGKRDYLAGRRWMAEGSTIRDLPDGACELTFRATGPELVSMVLSFGKTLRVIEPAWLRKEVETELQKALEHYRGVGEAG